MTLKRRISDRTSPVTVRENGLPSNLGLISSCFKSRFNSTLSCRNIIAVQLVSHLWVVIMACDFPTRSDISRCPAEFIQSIAGWLLQSRFLEFHLQLLNWIRDIRGYRWRVRSVDDFSRHCGCDSWQISDMIIDDPNPRSQHLFTLPKSIHLRSVAKLLKYLWLARSG